LQNAAGNRSIVRDARKTTWSNGWWIAAAYPDWGSAQVAGVVAAGRDGTGRNTIHRILLRHDLVHLEDRHEPAVERFERGAPNETVADGLQRSQVVATSEWGRCR